jgi:hypothetical protein
MIIHVFTIIDVIHKLTKIIINKWQVEMSGKCESGKRSCIITVKMGKKLVFKKNLRNLFL